MKEIIKCNYKLKPGVLIHVGGEAYSNANLTDEVAAAYLAKYPNTTFFEVVPSEPVEGEPVEDDATEEPIEPVEDATTDEATEEPVDDVPEEPDQVKKGRKSKGEVKS